MAIGKNKIQRKDTYKTKFAYNCFNDMTIVEALKKSKVFYISHDGVNLKPEYVRKKRKNEINKIRTGGTLKKCRPLDINEKLFVFFSFFLLINYVL